MRFVDFLLKEMDEHPERFSFRSYVCKYKYNRKYCEVWVGNGISFTQIYEGPAVFSFFDKIKFWMRYKRFVQEEMVKRYQENMESADDSKP